MLKQLWKITNLTRDVMFSVITFWLKLAMRLAFQLQLTHASLLPLHVLATGDGSEVSVSCTGHSLNTFSRPAVMWQWVVSKRMSHCALAVLVPAGGAGSLAWTGSRIQVWCLQFTGLGATKAITWRERCLFSPLSKLQNLPSDLDRCFVCTLGFEKQVMKCVSRVSELSWFCQFNFLRRC